MPKQPIPSPTLAHFRGGRGAVDQTAYPEMDAFFADLARVYREEIEALYAAGCRYVQIDETNLPFLCDPKLRDHARSDRRGPGQAAAALCRAAQRHRARPARGHDGRACTMCRGNHMSAWVAEGGYDPVAEVVFGGLEIDGFFLEYDSPRAGDFRAAALPQRQGKVAVLGLVTTKKPRARNRRTS